MTGGVSMQGGATWLDGAEQPPRPRRPRRRALVVTVLVALLAVLGVGAWLGLRAFQAATSLAAVADGVAEIRDRAAAGRIGDLAGPAEDVRRDAARAADATSDPVWRLAEALPVVGPDAVAVRTAAHGLEAIASDVMVPLLRFGRTLDPASLGPEGGQVDVTPLLTAQPVVEDAARAAAEVRAAVTRIEPERLHGPLPDAMAELREGVETIDDALGTAATLVALLPPMLGTEEPRDYLVLFLNSGELRAQGGIVGAMAVISADGGRLALTGHASTAEFPRFDEPVLPLSAGELAVASDVVGRRVQNPVILPDTPRVGELTAEMWRRARGQTVDGVVAVDPVALSYVLGATGGIRHPQGEILDAGTLLERLLVTVYADHPEQEESDAFFAAAASAVFGAITDGAGEPLPLLQALRRSVDERRLTVWSAHPEEQALILGTAVDGALLSGGRDEAVGVFLDNTSGWKTDTYLRSETTIESARCADGERMLEVRLRLTNTLGDDAASLPFYVVGDGSTGVPVGSMRMRVSVYPPVGGEVAQVRRDDAFVGASRGMLAGREVQVMTETLAPGQTVQLTFTVVGPDRGDSVPLWTSPTTSSPGLTRTDVACAAA